MALLLDADFRQRLRERSNQPPRAPRAPLWWNGLRIGSVQEDFFERLRPDARWVGSARVDGSAGWQVQGDLTESLHGLALAMREASLAHAWRDEQLAVQSEDGRVLGTIERAAVRPLGIPTSAVHLAGFSADGRHWVQQRSLTKPNDPGMWDTLMGGMVPASDSLEQALARETWEEAGLRMADLRDLRHGGRVSMRRPTFDAAGGYVVEWIDWYVCVVPDGAVPINQDGEVARFCLLGDSQVSDKLSRDRFTLEAALVLTECAS